MFKAQGLFGFVMPAHRSFLIILRHRAVFLLFSTITTRFRNCIKNFRKDYWVDAAKIGIKSFFCIN